MAVGLADLARAASVVAHPSTTEDVRAAFETETASDLDDLVVVQVSAGQLPGLRDGSRIAGACEPAARGDGRTPPPEAFASRTRPPGRKKASPERKCLGKERQWLGSVNGYSAMVR
jgi:hypothetical protein